MAFRNSTRLDTVRLMHALARSMAGWPLDALTVWVRYARGAAYSGTCYLGDGRIFVNLGRHLDYPYRLGTHIARTQSTADGWSKPIWTLDLADPEQLAVFIFRHECYHWLLQRARRNGRQKESMCDRFAARYLVEAYGCPVRDEHGRPASRAAWDFQDTDAFVATARRPRRTHKRGAQTAPGTDRARSQTPGKAGPQAHSPALEANATVGQVGSTPAEANNPVTAANKAAAAGYSLPAVGKAASMPGGSPPVAADGQMLLFPDAG